MGHPDDEPRRKATILMTLGVALVNFKVAELLGAGSAIQQSI